MKKPIYKRKWFIGPIIFIILGGIISSMENEDAVTEQNTNKVAGEIEEEFVAETREEEIELLIQDIVEEHYNRTSIKDITINENLGTDEEDDFITLVYLSFDAKNRAKTAKEMIDIYSSDLGARLADEKDITEIAIFWEVPYLKEDSNIAKFNLQRVDDKMVFKDKWYDNSIFN